jgi:cbb3-type cytochrome oxidase cytochrome c subunit
VNGVLVLLALGLGLVAAGCGGQEKGSFGSTVEAQVSRWAKAQGFEGNAEALAGARLFAKSGCTHCHTYLGIGSTNLGAPDLSAEAARGKGVKAQVEFLTCPSCVDPNASMPSFKALGNANLRKVAVFLEASKGKQ